MHDHPATAATTRAYEAGAHQGNGWRGKITRAQDPAMCASCHADEKVMQPYDLPVDQYSQYQTSGHGKLLAKGDGKVAVCSDCHGAHDVLSAHDPASRTYVTNVPRTRGPAMATRRSSASAR